MGPGDLQNIISRLPGEDDPGLLSSIHTGEDAGVYLIGEDMAIVQTVDFFPPIVDDPYTFGQIAAANALSDIYAMGARPLTALNLVAFPCELGLEVLSDILRGGQDIVHQSGAVIVGGHTIDDKEPKYGLAVTGLVKPSEMTTIDGARPGDRLVLTKPIGTGILATALKAEFISEDDMAQAIDSMRTLNRDAAQLLSKYRVSACTDVTGFGLIGHLFEMARSGGISAEVQAEKVPFFEKTLEMASLGMIPAGLYRNRDFVGKDAIKPAEFDPMIADCLFDPQTSGGLLAAVRPEDLEGVLGDLSDGPCPYAVVIGSIKEKPKGKIFIEF